MPEYTYLDPIGRSRAGESSAKEPVHRRAVARCKVRMLEDTANSIATGSMTKGDVLATARVAGMQAAKKILLKLKVKLILSIELVLRWKP